MKIVTVGQTLNYLEEAAEVDNIDRRKDKRRPAQVKKIAGFNKVR